MNKKSPADRISLATLNLMESAKDATTMNIMTASRTAQIEIKPEHLQRLLTLIGASVEEGFNRGTKSFNKVVTDVLADVAADAALPALTSKKKLA